MIVMKFGGTSVGDAARIDHVASLVSATEERSVVVTSALGGTTDALLEAGAHAEAGDLDGAMARLEAIRARHEAVSEATEVREALGSLFVDLHDLLHGVALLREQTSRSKAMLLSFGERLAVHLVAAALTRAGRHAVPVDARELLVTDDRHESAAVEMDVSRERVRARLLPLVAQGVVPVVTGFLGATRDGVTTVLGRGGSDYTGALVGAMLDAREVWIWTDVDGILSADPRLVRDARPLERVSFREAAEMSYFGAKVVHPKTMVPAMERGIPLRIRSTFEPDRPGTLISSDTSEVPFGVKVVTSIRKQALVTVEGSGMAGTPGIARRIFGTTEAAGINVVMISQASSEQTVSLVVAASDSARLAARLNEAFRLEIEAGLLAPVRVQPTIAVVSVIGEGMAGRPGVSARLFRALGRTGVNVLAIAQGGSELSISAAVEDGEVERAVRAIHMAFGLTRRVDVFVLGAGRVAQAFLAMLGTTVSDIGRIHGLRPTLLGIASSSRCLLDVHGLDPAHAIERLPAGAPRPPDEQLLEQLDTLRHGPVVLVDLTAADTGALHQAALDRGIHVVTANKLPISGTLSAYRGLVEAIRRTGARYGYETTFGAGLPVLHTLKELMHTGDEVASVSGCFSGTLGFLCTRLESGAGLSEAVREAAALGYTEPDPREDLSGRDVARKALIVARAMGLSLEPEDVRLEPLVPDLHLGLDSAVARFQAPLAARFAEAASRRATLRYVASITPQAVEVGLQEVGLDTAIGSLRGPDNILVFRTARYREYPLVVRGPGAGAEVTAAGVLGDLIRVASVADLS